MGRAGLGQSYHGLGWAGLGRGVFQAGRAHWKAWDLSLNRLAIYIPLAVCEQDEPSEEIMLAGSVLNWVRTPQRVQNVVN